MTEQINQGRGKIRKKKINGIEYYYEMTPYYDKETKNTKYHSKYLGKSRDGEIKKVRNIFPRSSYRYGEFLPLIHIIDKFHLRDILMERLSGEDASAVLAMAMNKVLRPMALTNISGWYESSYLSMSTDLDLSSQNLSRLLDRIGNSDLQNHVEGKLFGQIDGESALLYDITSIASYSNLPMSEYGHAKDHPGEKQVNLSLVTEKENGIPVMFDLYPGSIVDVSTLKNTLTRIRAFGMEKVSLILDRGFFSLDNLNIMKGMDFIMAASLSRKEIKSAFSALGKKIENANNVIVHGNRTIFAMNSKIRIEGMDIDAYFYYDTEREGEEKANFHRKLKEIRDKIESLSVRKGVSRTIYAIGGDYMKYIQYHMGETITTTTRKNAISHLTGRFGKFMIVYHGKYTAMECLSTYRERDAIEKAFESLKTDMEIFPLRVRNESTLKGLVLVFFISLIIRSSLVKRMNDSGLSKKYSVEKMLLELEKLSMVKLSDGSIMETERTARQKEIFKGLNLK